MKYPAILVAFLFAVLALLDLIGILASRSKWNGEPPEIPVADYAKYDVLHMPKSGDCPAGFRVVRDLFERDGRKSAGCVRHPSRVPAGDTGMVDYLLPQESITLLVLFTPAEEKRGKI